MGKRQQLPSCLPARVSVPPGAGASGMEIERQEAGGDDDITGLELDAKLERIARAEEIAYYRSMKVYDKVMRCEAFTRTGKAPIKVR